jgi:tRNA-splicing ligase RtcB
MTQGPRGGQIKAWINGVPLENAARTQLGNVAAMPFL